MISCRQDNDQDSVNILVVGDSNSDVWKILRKDLNTIYPTKIVIQRVPGTSAQGLCKMKNSSLQSGYRIQRILSDRKEYEWLIICAGCVDLEFVYYSKVSRQIRENSKPITLTEEADYCIEKYFEFIDDVVLKEFHNPKKVVLQAVHLPTLDDEHNRLRLNKPRNLGSIGDSILYIDGNVDPSILRTHRERTDAVLYFNSRLAEECEKRGMKVIDVNRYLIDEETNLIKNEMVRDSPLDVHINEKNAVKYYIQEFCKLEPRYNQ